MYKVKKATARQNYMWSIAASLVNSVHSVLMLALVSRFCGNEGAGVFSLSYSIAQMMYFICCFEMANVLITDAQHAIGFWDSAGFRLLSNGAMLLVAAGFCFVRNFTGEVLQTFAVLTLHMMLLSAAELCENHLHRSNYLNLSGRSMACDLILCDVAFLAVLLLTRDIVLAAAAMCCVTALWILLYDIPFVRATGVDRINTGKTAAVWKLLIRQCLPLVCMRLVMSYTMNAPKLSIDTYLTLTDQSYFGYMLMPASCINLLSVFMLRPQLVNMAAAYREKNRKWFASLVSRIALWDIAVSVCVLAGGYLLGIPILSVFYGVDLEGMRALLCTVLLGGCFYAFATLFDAACTTIRCQKWNLLAYIPTFLLSSFVSGFLVRKYGLMGAAYSYCVMMFLIFAGSGLILLIAAGNRFGKRDSVE